MEDKTITSLISLVVVLFVLLAAGYAVSKIDVAQKKKRGYEGNGGSGFWGSLWNNAANIVDAGGRHTAAAVTSTGNAISSIIATSKTGKAAFSQYGYSDEKQNYGPYVLGGALIVTAGVVAAIVLTKK